LAISIKFPAKRLHGRRFMRRHQRLASGRHACATAIIASEPWKDWKNGERKQKAGKVGCLAHFAMRAFFTLEAKFDLLIDLSQ